MGSFRTERSIVIAAPPETIVALIEDFHRWGEWSPWEGKDPDLKRTFSGKKKGVGAVYDWTGNGQVGTGRMEVLEATPTKVLIRLDFIKPIKADNFAEFTLTPQDGGTRVDWAMYGEQNLLMKVMSTVFGMEKAIQKDFDQGLAAMKAAAEGKQPIIIEKLVPVGF